jgi:ligand-binding sensor domain-containing protein/signal transduction histidine kinase
MGKGRFKEYLHLGTKIGRKALLLVAFYISISNFAAEGAASSDLFVGQNANGQLEVFKLDSDGNLYHRWRKTSNGAWSSWSSLGGSFAPGLAIINDSDGEMEIFGVDRGTQNLECARQLTTNSLDWSSWTNLGGTFEPSVTAEKNLDERIEIFAIDNASHHVKHIFQTSSGWSQWLDLGGSLQSGLMVKKNRDGRLELFGMANDGTLCHCWQARPNTTNDWSDWTSLGGAILPGFVVAENAAGRLELFAVNRTNEAAIRIYQVIPSDSRYWTAWQDFGANIKAGLAVGQSGDGRLELFVINATNSMLLHRWELLVNGSDQWSTWTGLGQKTESAPAVGANEDGDLEVFAVDPNDEDTIHYRRQISAASDWLDWSSLDQAVFARASRSWQADEGLPNNLVQAITQTIDGFLWVGTHGGLARFDGNQFVCYNSRNTPALKNSSITTLCAGKDGSLWIGTDGGGLIRLKGGIFTQFAQTNGLAGDEVRAIYESKDGSLWVGTTTGMSCYRNRKFHTYTKRDGLLSDNVRYIYEDRNEDLWIATGKGLNRMRRTGAMDAFLMPNGLPNDSVRTICQDQGGRIWIGSNNGLLWYNWFWGNAFYAYNTKYGLSDMFVSATCEDGDGNLWVGTYSGLNCFRDGRFYNQLDEDGQPFDKVNALFVDREGDLWVGSKEGLTRLTSEKLVTYTKQQGLTHNNIMSVLQGRHGNLWIGTWGGGLDEMQGEKVITHMLGPTNGLPQNLILSLCEGHDGSLWIGADFDGGLTRLKDGQMTRYLWHGGLNAGLRVLHEDTSGNLWIGTDRGLGCFKDGKFVTNEVTDSLEDNGVRDICEDESGSLWFATRNGLGRWQGGHFTMFTTTDGLSDNSVTALYRDDENTLWIGTASGGLNRYRSGQFTAYTTRQGLFSDEIFGILEDHGWLWMTSSKGIFRVRKKDLEAFDEGKIETIVSLVYGKNDGMESPQCNGGGKPSIWKSLDGRLWFPTSKGLVSVDPSTVKMVDEPPPVVIEKITADENVIYDGRQALAGAVSTVARQLSSVRIPPGRGELEFQYAALDFSAPEKDHFKYRLEGVDAGWIDAGIRRNAYYNNLAPGNYRFVVRACNKDGVWNQAGASLTVVLAPHYWEMLWFRGMVAFVIVGSACGAVLYTARKRIQRKLLLLEKLQAVERERGRIARDMHDQIGAGLTQIGLLGEFARRSSKNGDGIMHVEKICDTARELAQTLDEMVWMVNPKNDTLKKLGLYLAAYAEEFFKATDIRCLLDVPPGLPPCLLPAEMRHNLFLTVKEALTNIAKHSQASEARLRLSLKDSKLEIEIEDNGVGFSMDSRDLSRNGLSNMQERIQEIGGILDISSRPNNGTRICLQVEVDSRKRSSLQ